ncbi:hypothetical protein [Kitasatospora sp. LaBMicrA B282]|uniref:hypothetical protein n=1 Tax=Kitasatospora sp. LaBMicrA B282 TaxID=3420949 RepID=UPI003D0C01D6
MSLLNSSGRTATLWMLVAFIVTFAITRGITLMIRAGRGPFRDNVRGGLHIHHLVYGIFAMMFASLAEFAARPAQPWYEVLAVVFGVGAALTLDEYALWLHLGDVYWSQEGRKSVDVVVYAAAIGAVLLVASNPFARQAGVGNWAFAVSIAINLVFALLCAIKGKAFTSVCGVLIPLLAIIGAVRLATPDSPWSRWRYRPESHKLARARRRETARREGRLARWRDSLTGLGPGPH